MFKASGPILQATSLQRCLSDPKTFAYWYMTQDTLTWYGVPSTIPSHGGNSTGGTPCRRVGACWKLRGSLFIACWRVLEIARVGRGMGGYPPPKKCVGKGGGVPDGLVV